MPGTRVAPPWPERPGDQGGRFARTTVGQTSPLRSSFGGDQSDLPRDRKAVGAIADTVITRLIRERAGDDERVPRGRAFDQRGTARERDLLLDLKGLVVDPGGLVYRREEERLRRRELRRGRLEVGRRVQLEAHGNIVLLLGRVDVDFRARRDVECERN